MAAGRQHATLTKATEREERGGAKNTAIAREWAGKAKARTRGPNKEGEVRRTHMVAGQQVRMKGVMTRKLAQHTGAGRNARRVEGKNEMRAKATPVARVRRKATGASQGRTH